MTRRERVYHVCGRCGKRGVYLSEGYTECSITYRYCKATKTFRRLPGEMTDGFVAKISADFATTHPSLAELAKRTETFRRERRRLAIRRALIDFGYVIVTLEHGEADEVSSEVLDQLVAQFAEIAAASGLKEPK